MLLEFNIKNFRSIRDTQSLTMKAGAGSELVKSNLIAPTPNVKERYVRSAVIYGANAAGKTNLLRGLGFMQYWVLNSSTATQANQKIPYSPFMLGTRNRIQPSEFDITFSHESVRYQYGFSVTDTHIHQEWLYAYPRGRQQLWFERKYVDSKKEFQWKFGSALKGKPVIWRDATRENALYLSTAVQLNSEQLRPIFDWFKDRLIVLVTGIDLNPGLTIKLLSDVKQKETLVNLIKAADIDIDDLTISRGPLGPGSINQLRYLETVSGTGTPQFITIHAHHKSNDSDENISLNLGEESEGTKKLFNWAGALNMVLSTGSVLAIDELNNSFHPLMARFIVSLFHSNRTNQNAQLIFTTHDTTLLDLDIFRRDQIWFIEKDKQHSSQLYSLLEFSPRKTEALEKGYLKGRYGALPFIGEWRMN